MTQLAIMFADLMDQEILNYLHREGKRGPNRPTLSGKDRKEERLIGSRSPKPDRFACRLDKKPRFGEGAQETDGQFKMGSMNRIAPVSAEEQEDRFDTFYQKTIMWRQEREVHIQRNQRQFAETELQECTFSPKITKQLSPKRPEQFVSFSGVPRPLDTPPESHYTGLYTRREELRRTSPLPQQRSYRKVDTKANCFVNEETRKVGLGKSGKPQTLDNRISQLKSYLHNMEF